MIGSVGPFLYAVAALFTFQLLGEKALVRILGRPLPGALTGTLLLLGTRLHWVAWRVAGGLLQHMMRLFIRHRGRHAAL